MPDLAAGGPGPSNTRGEMDRELRDYFGVGVILAWHLDPGRRQVAVHEAVDRVVLVDEAGTLDGGAVPPGRPLRGADWFAQAG